MIIRRKELHTLINLTSRYIRAGKQVVWLDEANFNLFCQRKFGWSRVGFRSVQRLPTSRGPNVHLIGAIGTSGVVQMDRRRGSFKADIANEYFPGGKSLAISCQILS